MATNNDVRLAVERLGRALAARGATVRCVLIPSPNGAKVGIDDYLAAGNDWQALAQLAEEVPPERLETDAPHPLPSENRANVQTVGPEPPKLARDLRILDSLSSSLTCAGVVGERKLANGVYLAMTSRLLDRPVSLAAKGESASGKSYTTEAVVKFFPEEAYLQFTDMSQRALIYSRESYAHRTILIFEAEALRPSEDNMTAYYMRSLLSEGVLRYPVTVQADDGGFETREVVKEGPTNLIFTTTRAHVHAENETRTLSFTTDDSNGQTKAILGRIAVEAGGAGRDVDLEPWHGLQRWLEQHGARDAVVPHAVKLSALIPPVAVRLRRDFGSLISLVKTHAILHQCNRERDDAGRVVATLDDYAVVRELVADTIGAGVAVTVPPAVRETVEALSRLCKACTSLFASDNVVTATQVAHELGVSAATAWRRLEVAVADGYAVNLQRRDRQRG